MEKFMNQVENMVMCAGVVLGLTPEDVRFTVALMPPQVGGMFEGGHGEAGVITINFFNQLPFMQVIPMYLIVAHEMLHAKQWFDGRLVCCYDIATREPFVMWEGEEWRDFDNTDANLPWEKEAHQKMFSVGDQMAEYAEMLIAEHKSAA